MSELFATVPFIGDLYFKNIYLYYDEPQIFSCVTSTLQFYFIIAVPADGEEESAWLAVPVSTGKLSMLEKNLVEIRTAFTQPESLIWRLFETENGFYSKCIQVSELTEDSLPMPGAYLEYSGNSELQPSAEAPLDRAKNEMRDIIEISIEKDDGHISEISCDTFSEILVGVQQLLYAIAYKDGGLRGAIPRKIREDAKLCISDLFAASVGVRLKSNEYCNIHMETPLTATLRDFNKLFELSDDKESLHHFLADQNPRVAVKYRSLIRSLVSRNNGIKINNASPDNSTFTRHYTTKELAKKLDLVNSQVDEISETVTFYGSLVGANVERNSFEFISSEGENIKGVIAPEIRGNTFSVPQYVEIIVEVKVGTDSFTNEEKLVYTLQSIQPFAESQ